MLTYTQWLGLLANCRLDQYPRDFTNSLAKVTEKHTESQVNANQELEFVHFYNVVLILLQENRKSESKYGLFNYKDQQIDSLKLIPDILLGDLHFWKCVEFLDKHKFFTAPNLYNLYQNRKHAEFILKLLTVLKFDQQGLLTAVNVEKVMANGKKANFVMQVLTQLYNIEGLIKLVTQSHFDRLINYDGDVNDLYGVSLLIATINRNNSSSFFASLNADFFNLIMQHASLATHINLIFSAIDRKYTSQESMNRLLKNSHNIATIAIILRELSFKGLSEKDKSYCFKQLLAYPQLDVQLLKLFFTKVHESLFTDQFTQFIDLLFEHLQELSAITRLFILLKQLKGKTLKYERVLFLFQYKAVMFNPKILDSLEVLSKKGLLSSDRLEKLMLLCAHYPPESVVEIEAKLIAQIQLFGKSRPDSDEIKVAKRNPDKLSAQYNPDLRRFLSELDNNKLLNPILIESVEIEGDGVTCPISGAPKVTPVRLGNQGYDLHNLLMLKIETCQQERKNPQTGDLFRLNELLADRTAAKDIAKAIEEALKKKLSSPQSEIEDDDSDHSSFESVKNIDTDESEDDDDTSSSSLGIS